MLGMRGRNHVAGVFAAGICGGKLTWIDFQEERIAKAKEKCPSNPFAHGDATKLEFASESFDVVNEATMFIHQRGRGIVPEDCWERWCGRRSRAGTSCYATGDIRSREARRTVRCTQKRIARLFEVWARDEPMRGICGSAAASDRTIFVAAAAVGLFPGKRGASVFGWAV